MSNFSVNFIYSVLYGVLLINVESLSVQNQVVDSYSVSHTFYNMDVNNE